MFDTTCGYIKPSRFAGMYLKIYELFFIHV